MPHMLPPLTALRAFKAAARHGSFKLASHELSVTPSSISHQVQRLEDWLEVKLFHRSNRKVTLTTEGSTYYFALSKAFEDIDTVTTLVSRRRAKNPARRRLKIVADAGFVECWLGSRLIKLQALIPEVQLDIAHGQDIDAYLKAKADLAIHFGRGEWPEYDSVLLRTGYEFPVCGAIMVSQDGDNVTAPKLATSTLIHEKNMSRWTSWLRHSGRAHRDVERGPILNSTSAIFGKVAAGEGIALGDDIVAADLLFSGDLVKPWGPVRQSDHSLYFLQFGATQGSDLAKVVGDWLSVELETHKNASAQLRSNSPYIAPKT